MKLTARGKIFGFVIIEDVFVVSGTLGLEYKFLKRHSIGADVIWTKYWLENDSIDAVTGKEYSVGDWQYDTRQNYMVDYRFYFSVRNKLCKYRGLYLSAFHRHGTMKWRSSEEYKFDNGDDIFKDAVYNDLGLAIGLRLGGDRCRRWGIDTNLGMTRRTKVEDYVRYLSDIETDSVINERSIQWLPLLRFNVTYSFILPKHLRVTKHPDISE
jgi:hypothetical protein